MNDDTLRSAYRELLAGRAGDRTHCVTPVALLAVVNGTAAEAERLATLRHVAACHDCRTELDLLRTAGEVAERVARPAWQNAPWLAAAASVLVLSSSVAVWLAVRAPAPDALRAGGATDVKVIEPALGALATLPVTLVWAAVPDARRYELEVLRPDGSAVWATTLRDTTVILPAAAALASGIEYRWWIRAVLTDGTSVRSGMQRLRVTP